MKCRCGRDAAILCPSCRAMSCSSCARVGICLRCGGDLLVDPDRFDAWLASHLSDQEAARSLEDKVV